MVQEPETYKLVIISIHAFQPDQSIKSKSYQALIKHYQTIKIHINYSLYIYEEKKKSIYINVYLHMYNVMYVRVICPKYIYI